MALDHMFFDTLNLASTSCCLHSLQAYGLKHIGFGPLKKENQDEFYIQVSAGKGKPVPHYTAYSAITPALQQVCAWKTHHLLFLRLCPLCYAQIGNFGGQPHGNCFCVFDGHGVHGARVSAYCQKELPKVLDAALRKYHEEVRFCRSLCAF